ncbi:MAG: hypothetical protein GY757_25065 [bacterium]|nr:hypothetical protein [bacterium]
MLKEIREHKKTAALLSEIFFVTAVLAISFKLCYEVSEVMDIRFFDETAYLRKGIQYLSANIFKDGFIYFLWYKILSFFAQDGVTLYYLNYVVLLSINPLLIYILLRKMRKGKLISAAAAIILLVSNCNVITWPFITRFASALILITFILIFTVKSSSRKYIIALSGLFLLVYTRPENTLPYILFSLVSIIYLLHKYRKTMGRVYIYLAIITLVAGVFTTLVKNPATTGRSILAFGQHYALNLHQRGEIKGNPNTTWKKVMRDNFGTDKSLIAAFSNNPGKMIKHIRSNIARLPLSQLIAPYKLKGAAAQKIFIIVIALLFLLSMVYLIKDFKKKIRAQKVENPGPGRENNEELTAHRLYYILSLLITMPLLISVCLIYPREHYILILFVVGLVLAAKHLPEIPKKPKYHRLSFVLILLIVYWVPWRATATNGLLPGDIKSSKKKCTNLMKLQNIKKIAVKSGITYLGSGGSMEPYINNFQYVKMTQKKEPFNEFLQQHKINMVYINGAMRRYGRYKTDAQFKQFINGVPNENWAKFKIRPCEGFLAVKKEILQKTNKQIKQIKQNTNPYPGTTDETKPGPNRMERTAND